MKIYLAAMLLLVQITVFAQPKPKLKFKSINNAGLLAGASANALQLQTINGLSYRSYSAGIGIGVDNYYIKTVPLFVDLRKAIFDKKETPFLYLDLGADLPRKKVKQEMQWQQSDFNKGFYYDLGLGYSWTLTGSLALNFSVGYSQKNIKATNSYRYFIWTPVRTYEDASSRYDYNYSLRRLTIKAGLSF